MAGNGRHDGGGKRRAVVRAALAAAAIGIVAGAWMALRSDDARIRRVFGEVERTMARESGESVMEGAIKAKSASTSFIAEAGCTFAMSDTGGTRLSRDEVAGTMLAFRNSVPVLKLRFPSLDRKVSGDVAEVEGMADFSGSAGDFAGTGDAPQTCAFHAGLLREPDGRWRFSRVNLKIDK